MRVLGKSLPAALDPRRLLAPVAQGPAWDGLVQVPSRLLRPRAGAAEGIVAKPINAALQGGGAHGAFTWGVLDRLLEDGRVRFEAVSGTSAGAMNAVALAAGLIDGGADGARASLEAFWRAVSETARYSPLRPHPLDLRGDPERHDASARVVVLDLLTRLLSPYQLNPLDFNPLREVLEETVNFRRLREKSPIAVFIAATDVATGERRIFDTGELSVDAVLASACLPHLHKAVKVGRRHYWDGGYSANPPILPLVDAGRAPDTLIVQLDPSREPEVPTTARAIIARINRITFNAPLRREVELIERLRDLAGDGFTVGGHSRRLRRHRFHHIEARNLSRDLGSASKLHPDWGMLCRLRDRGRTAADAWLRRNLSAVGDRSTVDLAAKFL